jgi:hypothetical protein
MAVKITGSPVRPGIIWSMGAVHQAKKTFYVCVQNFTFYAVMVEGPQKFGDAGGRFTRLGYGGMNKNHARSGESTGLHLPAHKTFNCMRPASSFFRGHPFHAEPLTIHPAVIHQLGMITTDAVQDFFPFFYLPFDQKFRFPLFFGAFHFPDAPFGFFAHGRSLFLKDENNIHILTRMNSEVYIQGGEILMTGYILSGNLLGYRTSRKKGAPR